MVTLEVNQELLQCLPHKLASQPVRMIPRDGTRIPPQEHNLPNIKIPHAVTYPQYGPYYELRRLNSNVQYLILDRIKHLPLS